MWRLDRYELLKIAAKVVEGETNVNNGKNHDNLEGFYIQIALHQVQIQGQLQLEFIDDTLWMWFMQELGTPINQFIF